MAIEIETKDCTALSDAELAEMADICAEGPSRFEVGLLSKQAEAWVLVTLAREDGTLKGFSFCTLERIGGTPSVLIGLASVKRTSKRDACCGRSMTDQFRRAVLAFPDEDVLVGTRFATAVGLRGLQDPRRHRAPARTTRPPARSGPGAAAWPSASASRTAATTTARFIAKRRRHATRWCSTTRRLKPEKLDPEVVGLLRRGRRRPGRLAHRLRLGDGRATSPSWPDRRRRSRLELRGRPSAAGGWCGPSRRARCPRASSTASARPARRAPSAGNSQGIGLRRPRGPEETGRYWDVTLPAERRAGVPVAGPARGARRWSSCWSPRPSAYVDALRRARQGGDRAWATAPRRGRCPYWWVDAGAWVDADCCSAAVDAGLGRAASSASSTTRPR